MPEKFIVPQFIDNEDKILGPITVRQFLICLVATFLLFIEYKILKTAYFVFAAVLTVGVAGTFGFLKINGQPFHVFFVNFLQTSIRPALRVWDKRLIDSEIRDLLKKAPDETKVMKVEAKPRPSSTRLRDLSLTVNTGGVYNAEDENS